MYTLAYHKQAIKTLAKMPRNSADRVRSELLVLAGNPERYRGDWKPLSGTPFGRLRVGGWRAICELRETELIVYVLKVGSRGDILQMNVQIISRDKKPEFAVIPFDEWEKLQDRLEDLEDVAEARALSARITSGEDETFPGAFVERLFSGEHPLTVWREFRGMTRGSLAAACGVSAPAISQIESGKREPSASLLKRMALTLHCSMDDLMPSEKAVLDSEF